MLIQDFLFFCHTVPLHFFFFLQYLVFMLPKPEFIPKPTGLLPSLGQPNDISSQTVVKFDRNFSCTTFPPLWWWIFHGIMYELLILPNLRAQRETGFHWRKAAWKLWEPWRKRKCISYIQKLQMCWFPPHQSKTNPKLHSKVSRARVGEEELNDK